MARGLQGRLRELAQEQGVSMNALITQLLAGAVGWRPQPQEDAPAPLATAGRVTQQEVVPDEQKAD
jgi:hypothetical protein